MSRRGRAVMVVCLAFAIQDAHSVEADILVDPLALPGQELAYAMAMDGVRIVTGSPGFEERAGTVHVFDCSGLPCPSPVVLRPSDLATGDLYGTAVAVDGDTVVVGASGQLSGAVYVHLRDGDGWTQQARLTAADGAPGDAFGMAVALEGNRLVIGASAADDGAGAAYVFTRVGATWSQQARLSADDAVAGDRFGASVALSGDTLLIGAPFDASGPPNYARGSVHVYLAADAAWTVQARLEAPLGANGELFGSALALRDDRAVIAAPLASARRGAAHVFERIGAAWNHRQQIVASDGLAGDRFGWSVALGDDVALVGAPYWLEGCGTAYLYRPSGGVWTQTAEASVAAPLPGNLLGWSVGVSGDRFGLGAPGYAGAPDHSGAVYWFGDTDAIFTSGFEATPGLLGEEGCVPKG
jgi:hypothetical protein